MTISLDPIDREIIRTMLPLHRAVSPAQIAKTINIHPATAKSRMEILQLNKILFAVKIGSRLKFLLNKSKVH